MKVLHVITGLNDGGAEGVLYRLVTHSTGHTHIVVSLMDEGKYGPLLREEGAKVFCLGMSPGRPSFKGLWQLVRLIRFEKPNAVQTWMYHADLFGGIAARIAGTNKVFWGIRQSILEKGKAKSATLLIARLCGVLSWMVPRKIVCCAQKGKKFHQGVGYAQRKFVVIFNGYDLSKFSSDELAASELRAEMDISSDTFLIGMVARYNPIKDHQNLLFGLSRLSNLGLNYKCLLVGRGLTSDNQELMARINELGLADKVILAGQRTDIPAVMNALDLHVLSSSSEGFPNVLAEAMACGTPAVSTDVGDAGEIVGDPVLLCPPRDPKALSELMLAMHVEWLEKPEDWADRRISCVGHIKNNFSIERMVAAYEQCWFGYES